MPYFYDTETVLSTIRMRRAIRQRIQNEGAKARQEDKGVEDCPYSYMDRYWWLEGWYLADKLLYEKWLTTKEERRKHVRP